MDIGTVNSFPGRTPSVDI
jgi:hypothetical protein